MHKTTSRLIGVLLFLGVTLSQTAIIAQSAVRLKVARLTLTNGLTVLALEDHTVPSVAVHIVYKVGSRNEHPGITGLSHLFEHMMFNGSAKFAPKVFDTRIEAGGGYSNAFTTSDTTEYHEEFSSGTLDTVLQLEADRMRALKLDKANIEQERGIVKEERRVGIDNTVSGAMSELLWNTAFVAHPYRWDTVGFMKDLDAIRLEDARTYFRTYYAPNNAVMAVVGDFDTKTLLAKVQKYFSDIPRQKPPRPVVNAEPPQQGERRIALHRPAELPAVTLAYHVGTYRDADDPALDLLGLILSHGESGRLYRKLVYEDQIAAEASGANESRIDPGLFTFYAQAREGHTTAECEAAIYAILDDIAKNGVTEPELQKAKNVTRVGFEKGFLTNAGRAGQLAEYEANWGSWTKLYDYLPRHDRVTSADIQRVAKKTFSDRNRTVVTLIPEKEEASSTQKGGAK
jgi:zinc protease